MPPLRDIGAAVKLPINIAVLGAESVGKTSLTLQFINETKVELESCQPTIEASFFKDVKLRDQCSSECDSICLEELKGNGGAECFWKMDHERPERKHPSSIGLRKQKHNGSNNNVCEQEEFKMVLKVTDTARYKATHGPRKSLKERLSQKLALRRRDPVSSSRGPVRRRYLHNTEKSPESMNAVPAFIYRKSGGRSTMHDSVIHSADAFILVYSVQDRESFEILQKIRSHIHSVRGCPCATTVQASTRNERAGRRRRLGSSLAGGRLGSCLKLPPIVVVGTHIDLTAPLVSPCIADDSRIPSNESFFNYAFSSTPKRLGGESRERTLQTQISITAEVLQESTPRSPEVTVECIRGVLGTWPECVGYAEMSNNNVPRVRRIFGHLASQVLHRRTCGSSRKRMDSVLSVFSRKPEAENSSFCSCWPFKLSCITDIGA